MLSGIPVEFLLFGLTLVGVAVFHRYTLPVALTGLGVIVGYKLAFTGFRTGPGLIGLAQHLLHEWVILTNLLGLLLGSGSAVVVRQELFAPDTNGIRIHVREVRANRRGACDPIPSCMGRACLG